MKKFFLLIAAIVLLTLNLEAQHSVVRKWNEVLLEGIRNDFARSTVHARNLFHVSASMYDVWAIFDYLAESYLLGQQVHGFKSTFDGFTPVTGTDGENMDKALSYAAYRIIEPRFANSPDVEEIMTLAKALFADLGYDFSNSLTDYSNGSSAAPGNYIAEQYIQDGLQDGSNEENDYSNEFYLPSNNYLFADDLGNPTDQPGFLSPEWRCVVPFSLTTNDLTTHTRHGNDYLVYHDLGPPPLRGEDSLYRWNFAMVAVWSGHLDTKLDAEIDISPAYLGNFYFSNFPTEFDEYDDFYDFRYGGDVSSSRLTNPSTGLAYEPSVAKLSDYGRILTEFWADELDSQLLRDIGLLF